MARTRTPAHRQLRGLVVLACAAAFALLVLHPEGASFALPLRQQHPQQTEARALHSRATAAGAQPARPSPLAAPFVRAPASLPKAAGGSADFAGKDLRATDAVSLALAAAGAATALRAAAEAAAEKEEPSLFEKSKVGIYIGLWYLFNIGYNIYNKKALLIYPYPWACALWQMAFGWLIFVPLWLFGVRKVPKLTVAQAIKISPSALGHLATHVGAVVAFFAGAVSFGHIVKASEPVVSSILNFVFMGEVLAWPVYAALLPIIGGVALASASELSFNWLCFGAAMGSNLGSAARAVYSKKVMSGGDIGENMDSANVYAVLTIMATFMLIPISLAIEGPSGMMKGFNAAYAAGGTQFLLHMVYSGFFYYMYNEVAFLALGQLDPVTHAVSNTMKRVVIIITA
eukprot:CAMPEP_0179101140 /NCGR_PEP_ID=MMETSP0796-20121207/46748_1 /TAXON_ID=73915 /ORGANISM="Pyrodinium bahamense, Strain pbaha01" /LENGTH=400 /DNA_ID=CAMNT_0020798985 /DNA_START=11 /DNA_END=1209 /DNA_ORIENTATION=+